MLSGEWMGRGAALQDEQRYSFASPQPSSGKQEYMGKPFPFSSALAN
jgi:hypothetical protein